MNPPLSQHQHRCGVPVLSGWDADRCALFVTLEPRLLSPLGEVEALRAGRRTYHVRAGRPSRRDRWNIPGRPPSLHLPVVTEHRCDEVIHRAWLLELPPAPAPSILTDEIGF